MCQFFSLVSNGHGKIYYFDAKIRKQILGGKLKYELDSHTSIADYFGFKGKKEDILNKYEYDPLTKDFRIDQLNAQNDSENVKKQCNQLDFSKIVPELIIKSVFHPFRDKRRKKVNQSDLASLIKWASVWDSVGDSVWDSVGASVGDSVRDSVGASVGDSVWDSVGASVWDSVWDSVGASVGAYISSFFNLDKWKYVGFKKGKNPFQSCIDLWESGLLASFDGKKWRLHGGKDAKVLWKGLIND